MCVLVNLSRVLRDYYESRNRDLEITCSQANVPRSIFAYSYHLKGNLLHAMTGEKCHVTTRLACFRFGLFERIALQPLPFGGTPRIAELSRFKPRYKALLWKIN